MPLCQLLLTRCFESYVHATLYTTPWDVGQLTQPCNAVKHVVDIASLTARVVSVFAIGTWARHFRP